MQLERRMFGFGNEEQLESEQKNLGAIRTSSKRASTGAVGAGWPIIFCLGSPARRDENPFASLAELCKKATVEMNFTATWVV